jgi:hypothetical protein
MATLKLVFGFVLFGMVALVCYKLLPPFFANYELEDSIKTEATQSTYSTRSEDDIRASIIKQARGYDIALTPRQVHVLRVGSFGTGTLDHPQFPSFVAELGRVLKSISRLVLWVLASLILGLPAPDLPLYYPPIFRLVCKLVDAQYSFPIFERSAFA